MENGFEQIALESKAANVQYHSEIIKNSVAIVVENFKNGKSTIIHTSIGPNDTRIRETELYFKNQGLNEDAIQKQCSKIYGNIIGQITKKVVSEINIKRIVFAGGDTSSYAASELNISALEMIAPLAPGAPLCKAISDDEYVNGLELNFKGGQVGTDNYFIKVLKGEKL